MKFCCQRQTVFNCFSFCLLKLTSKGKIVENSPAEKCQRLSVGDRILAVNGIAITHMNHIEIVKLIKESGQSITLTIGSPFLVDGPNHHHHHHLHNQQQQQSSNAYHSPLLVTCNELVSPPPPPPPPPHLMNHSQSSHFMQQQQQQKQQQHNGTMRPPYSQSISPNLMTPPQPTQVASTASSSLGSLGGGSGGGGSGSGLLVNKPTPALTINHNEYHVIELRKHATSGFGFSIRGGKEFHIPLFVLKLAECGVAALDARLRVGDQILEINGVDAHGMTHAEAIERIKASGNAVTLLIRRTGLPPPSITDIITVNSNLAAAAAATSSSSTVSGGSSLSAHQHYQSQQQQQQQQQHLLASSMSNNNLMCGNGGSGIGFETLNGGSGLSNGYQMQLRSKSPYVAAQQQQQQQQQQQPVKHFNSSGTLINRNY